MATVKGLDDFVQVLDWEQLGSQTGFGGEREEAVV
jgi:hypothetical protein